MKVQNMTSTNGKPVPNQFIITDKDLCGADIEVFQSYKSVIVKRIYSDAGVWTTLDKTYWNYSKTTSKYRNQFLGETTKETQAKIDSGEYVLTDLN